MQLSQPRCKLMGRGSGGLEIPPDGVAYTEAGCLATEIIGGGVRIDEGMDPGG